MQAVEAELSQVNTAILACAFRSTAHAHYYHWATCGLSPRSVMFVLSLFIHLDSGTGVISTVGSTACSAAELLHTPVGTDTGFFQFLQ